MGEDSQQNKILKLLRNAGLRPTRQRAALGQLLFGASHRHVTAEILHAEALRNAIPVSLATVYNTLHQLTKAGLLREVAVEGSKTYFDTNTSDHHHFYFEQDGQLIDIEDTQIAVVSLPQAPEGTAISRVDVLIRLTGKNERSTPDDGRNDA